MTTPTKEQSLDIERAMGFEIPWYRIEEIIIRWEKIRNSPEQGKTYSRNTGVDYNAFCAENHAKD